MQIGKKTSHNIDENILKDPFSNVHQSLQRQDIGVALCPRELYLIIMR